MLVPNFFVWRQDFPKEKPLPEVHQLDQTTFGKGSARSFPAWIPMTSTTSYLVQVRALLGIHRRVKFGLCFTCKSETFHRNTSPFDVIYFVHGRYLILFHTYRYYTHSSSKLCEAKNICTDSRCHTYPYIFVPYWSFVEPSDLAVRVCCLERSGFLASSPPRRIAFNLLTSKNGQSFVWQLWWLLTWNRLLAFFVSITSFLGVP